MVQRVYRQIRNADPSADILIATSKSQVSAIHNQLWYEHDQIDDSEPGRYRRLMKTSSASQMSEEVSVSVEPCRRDTFPAILLAVSYLTDVMHKNPEEPVIICPVDPFVNDDYYKTVISLSEYVVKDSAKITLMGIEPTYPSSKYGYIIPAYLSEKEAPIKSFKEKPE
jgi:mannose-1-phosphate guanylyltransferase